LCPTRANPQGCAVEWMHGGVHDVVPHEDFVFCLPDFDAMCAVFLDLLCTLYRIPDSSGAYADCSYSLDAQRMSRKSRTMPLLLSRGSRWKRFDTMCACSTRRVALVRPWKSTDARNTLCGQAVDAESSHTSAEPSVTNDIRTLLSCEYPSIGGSVPRLQL
jgi:hypothetical protein